jgi:hypothetical protein
MLARTFKSAKELGLTDIEHESLVTVLGMLERGELRYEPAYRAPSMPNGFHMAPHVERTDCGTVACIAGWANIVSGHQAFRLKDMAKMWLRSSVFAKDAAKVRLFRGMVIGDETPEMAAQALRNYLATGESNWPEVYTSSKRALEFV